MNILAFMILILFYGIYFGKQIAQKRQGIQTRQLGRRKEKGIRTTEILLSAATVVIVPMEVFSILSGQNLMPMAVRIAGAVAGLLGNLVFLTAILTMKNSWRAGIPEKDKTAFVSGGIYKYSRNPAFLGFDMVYVGILLMYFNWSLLIFTIWAMVMLHMQILQEEKYLPTVFGEEYLAYKERTCRYLGKKGYINPKTGTPCRRKFSLNKYTKNLNRIEFAITMACTGRCKHCSEGEHISSGEHMNGDIAAKAVDDICKSYDIKSIMTFGGEPLLYPEDVCKIHAAAKENGIQSRSLITNGFFSKDKKRIKEVAHMLAENGVDKILLSIDAFHQETIPIEPVMFFAECVKREGIYVRVHPAWLVSAEDDNPYNIRTRDLLGEFEQMDIQVSGGNVIFPSGNAKKYLSEYFDDNREYVNPYKDNPRDIHTIKFKPNGDVLGGNVNNDNVMDIIGSYNGKANKHPIIFDEDY